MIPLSANVSRGDQILNADSFKHQGFSEVLTEEELTPILLMNTINKLYNERNTYIAAMEKSKQGDSIDKIVSLIEEASGGSK